MHWGEGGEDALGRGRGGGTWIKGWMSLCSEVTRRLVMVAGDT